MAPGLMQDDPDAVLRMLCEPAECQDEVMETFSGSVKGAITQVGIAEFIELLQSGLPCVDARSPGEYEEGHIPGASMLPLFNNEERAKVGTYYKMNGRTKALQVGMSYVRPKLESFIKEAGQLCEARKTKKILVHCWRGGMRSCSLAWHLQYHGNLEPIVLKGGYKAFRAWQAEVFGYIPPKAGYKDVGQAVATPEYVAAQQEWRARHKSLGPRIAIVGGRTGVGKTKLLHALRDQLGQQIIDLEGLAHHNGSAFGFVGWGEQPTPQQYTNDVAIEWAKLDPAKWVFIEDEGPNVGKVSTPVGLYHRMRSAPVVLRVLVPTAARVNILLEDYTGEAVRAKNPDWQERMEHAVGTLQKRLGGAECAQMMALLKAEDYATFAERALQYYDKLYDKHLKNADGTGGDEGSERPGVCVDIKVDDDCTELDAVEVAQQPDP